MCAVLEHQMADVAGDMFRWSKLRRVSGMKAMKAKMALAVWKDVIGK